MLVLLDNYVTQAVLDGVSIVDTPHLKEIRTFPVRDGAKA